jgi:CP family cyanate transporter-like MFS transporter
MTETLSPYRWVIEVLLFLTLCAQAVTWLAPAPILGPIIKNLGISLGDAGLIISIIALCIAIFSLIGAIVAARLGALRALLLGIWLMSIGGILSGYATTFAALLACRVLEGVGFGVLIAPPGTLVMQWFGMREWPYINMANALCSYVGLTAVYSITAPIYIAAGHSWQRVLLYYGLATAGVAVGWTLLGREHSAPAAVGAKPERATIAEIMKMRDVVLMGIGLFGGMWVFQLYTAFLPEYFHTIRHMNLTESSAMTAVLPLTGIFAAGGGGIATGIIGLRKPFSWPLAIVATFGCMGAIVLEDPAWIRVALVLFGIGAAGGLSALITLLMELPGMTPAKMGTGLAFVWAVGYAGAFVAPFLGGAVAGAVGLRAVMLGFLAFQALPICAMYLLPETGPGRKRYELAASVGAAAVEGDRGGAAVS